MADEEIAEVEYQMFVEEDEAKTFSPVSSPANWISRRLTDETFTSFR